MRYPPSIVAACAAIQLIPLALASPAASCGPETGQTYADNTILWHQLRWLPGSQALVATITFSNIHYVSDNEPRHDETLNFPLSGVRFDSQNGAFFLRDSDGRSIAVAVLRRKLFVQSVELLPNAQVQVMHRSGRIVVGLVVNHNSSGADQWVEFYRSKSSPFPRLREEALGSS
jgi:hypothetical protein